MGQAFKVNRGGGIDFPVKYFGVPVYGNQVRIPVDKFPEGSSGAVLIPWGNTYCVFIFFSVFYVSDLSAVVASMTGYLACGSDGRLTDLSSSYLAKSDGAYYPINLRYTNGVAVVDTSYAGEASGFAIRLS